jgi:phosphatidate cytidylyltransferase
VLAQRVATAVVAIPILVVALFLGSWAIGLVALVLSLGAGFETFRLLRQAGYPVLGWLGTALGAALVVAGALAHGGDDKSFLYLTVGTLLVAIGAFAQRDPHDGLAAWAMTTFGGFYVGLLGFVPRLAGADIGVAPGASLAAWLDGGRWWLVVAVLGVWTYDTGAYFAGRTIGGPRFLTAISPSKTWAGAIGGLVATTVVAALLLLGLGRSGLEALLVGPLVAITAQAGDLAESMLKRSAEAKDSGTLFPGHGGVLDRVDSILFAVPAVYLYALAVGAIQR